MAKQRYINTRLWADSWVADLDPVEKLLFIYLLTNEHTEICGIYELPIKYMSLETGIEKEMIEKILGRFEKDGKVNYFKGWIFIKNFVKNQMTSSPKVKTGIELSIKRVPASILSTFSIPYPYPIHNPSHSDSDSDSNPNPKSSVSLKKGKTVNPHSKQIQEGRDKLFKKLGWEK